MQNFLRDTTSFDPIKGYKILNTIVPKYTQTEFPYSEITPDKIIFTKKKIEIIAKKVNDFKNKSIIKGGNRISKITIYG